MSSYSAQIVCLYNLFLYYTVYVCSCFLRFGPVEGCKLIRKEKTNPHVQSYKKIKLGCGCSCVASSCWTEEREGRSSWRADFYSGGLLFSMGLLGYIFSRSTISLVLGITPGLATLLLGTLSLKFWRSDRSSFLLILAQAGKLNRDLFGFQMVCWS
ncbi:hypothetical protein ZEAMMB73_Zm00001d023724 [Zea mays]|uniref:Protein FATTY ACID EXPORT 1 chloroplastic n=1 Tax=Zea mays TaxID=4577 RepID=A0A1D6IV63_MAIZE|nr:hypothetical protein ZEAMMB73_Zm00001d023724 [Zea mays]